MKPNDAAKIRIIRELTKQNGTFLLYIRRNRIENMVFPSGRFRERGLFFRNEENN